MKKDAIIPLCLGMVIGIVVLTSGIWIWQLISGDIEIVSVLMTIMMSLSVFILCQFRYRKAVLKIKNEKEYKLIKYTLYYNLMASWMQLKNEGGNLSLYLENTGLKYIAVYGMGRLGQCLCDELKQSNVNVKYGIDKKAEHFSYLDLKVISPEADMEEIDAIIVTPICEYESIAQELRKKTKSKIISLEDIIASY